MSISSVNDLGLGYIDLIVVYVTLQTSLLCFRPLLIIVNTLDDAATVLQGDCYNVNHVVLLIAYTCIIASAIVLST